MKKIITIIAAALLFISCSEDEPEVLQPTEFGVYLKSKDGSEITLDYKLSENYGSRNNPIKEDVVSFSDDKIIKFIKYSNVTQGYIELNLTKGDINKLDVYYFALNGNMYYKYDSDKNLIAKSILEINKPSNIQEFIKKGYWEVSFPLKIENYANGEWLNSETWKPL